MISDDIGKTEERLHMLSYIQLTTTDPAFNLAAEEYVFESLPQDRSYLMLWQNDHAVIIGKYQNTLAEINLPYAEQHHIRVVRRLSGGGAVYHDLGNLNYTFITDAEGSETLNMRLFCEPVVRVLKKLGVNAEINGRNDLTVDGKKFSGNAQYLRHGRIMHHGTILFNSDLSVMSNVLRVNEEKITAKGIRSVRSRVTNLLPCFPSAITLEDFRQALLDDLLSAQPGDPYAFSERDLAEIAALRDSRYNRWEWNFGRSPSCTVIKNAYTEGCGFVEARISLDKGLITGITFCGDFFSMTDPEELAPLFIGQKPDSEGFRTALAGIDVSSYFFGLTGEKLLEILCS